MRILYIYIETILLYFFLLLFFLPYPFVWFIAQVFVYLVEYIWFYTQTYMCIYLHIRSKNIHCLFYRAWWLWVNGWCGRGGGSAFFSPWGEQFSKHISAPPQCNVDRWDFYYEQTENVKISVRRARLIGSHIYVREYVNLHNQTFWYNFFYIRLISIILNCNQLHLQ